MTAQDIQSKALQRIRADVRAMQGYHVQPAQGLLKMDTMENPYRLPVDLQKKLGEHLGALEINRYPGERLEVLKKMLADYVPPAIDQGVDEALREFIEKKKASMPDANY